MENEKQNSFSELWKFVFITIVIVLPIRLFVAKPFIVNGPSMDPTFRTGQYLIIDQITYRVREITRGDVVVFTYPYDTSKYYIKRVIGLPGETVAIENGKVKIYAQDSSEATILDESYLSHTSHESAAYQVGADEYFVMGDNRPSSSDSRSWGNLQKKYIVGRPLVRLFPLATISLLPGEITK